MQNSSAYKNSVFMWICCGCDVSCGAAYYQYLLPEKFKCDEACSNFILQLYSSMDFGRKWQLVHDNVMPGRFYWYDYVDPIYKLFCTVIDCNLHNYSVHDPMLSEGSSDLLSKTDLPNGSQAQNRLYPCHVDLEEYCASFSTAQTWHAVFVVTVI